MHKTSQACVRTTFDVTEIQVNLPVTKSFFKSNQDQRFFVSASDGIVTQAMQVATHPSNTDDCVRWTERLKGFTVDGPSSMLTLHVFEDRKYLSNKLIATFIMSFDMLCLSRNDFNLVEITEGAKQKKHSLLEMQVKLSNRCIAGPPLNALRGSLQAKDVANELSEPHVDMATTGMKRTQMLSEATVGILGFSGQIPSLGDTTSGIRPLKGSVNKWKTILDSMNLIMDAVSSIAELHPYVKVTWSVLSFIPMKIAEQIQLDEDVISLLDAMEQALHLAPETGLLDVARLRSSCERSANRRKTLLRMMAQISECGHFIQSYVKDVDFWKRFIKNIVGNQTGVVKTYREKLKQLREDFLSEVIVSVDITVIHTHEEVVSISKRLEEHELGARLRELPYGIGTKFDPKKGCLHDTRVQMLKVIIDWVNNPDPSLPVVLMLFGQAGTGKSTIAHEVARRFHDMGRLTTSYFFSRGNTFKRESYRFFTTLARDLSSSCPAYRASLGNVINNNPDLVYAQDYTTLFESLLREPLKDLHFVGPVFIILDALDESEDISNMDSYTPSNNTQFHSFLAKHLHELPSNFRILVTSRQEAAIEDVFPESSLIHRIRMDDADLAGGVDDDILTYMETKLCEAGVDKDDFRRLVAKAEHLFQWASVACHYITHPPPGLDSKRCIQRVLSPINTKKGLNPLDSLYRTVLERFDMDDADIRDSFQSVMGQILCVFEPLSINSLNTIGRYAADGVKSSTMYDVALIVEHLGSLLSNTASTSTLPIIPLHTSFRDFLTDPERSRKFHVNLNDAHSQLAYGTLRTMLELLDFNICKLTTSYSLNCEVQDLNQRIKTYIPSALSYSCRFWADHLTHAQTFDNDTFECVLAVFEEKFLFWLEVLSVSGELAIATTALLSLRTWLSKIPEKTERMHTLDALANDAAIFVQYFGVPMSQSVAHIYLSALPFVPSSSIVSKLYAHRFPNVIKIEQGRLTHWPPLVMTISPPTRENAAVCCVAFSTNDRCIAAGLSGGTVCVWNASTGMAIGRPFGAEDRTFVSAIAFSHDGQYLASGLSNGRIRIWDLAAMQEFVVGVDGIPFMGHTGHVSALSFSKDGMKLMSGSGDCTVRIWDLNTGEVAVGPLDGHSNPIHAVSFLPDNNHVLSRSGFRAVQVWNMKTGKKARGPFSFEEMVIPTGTTDSSIYFLYGSVFYRDWSRIKSKFVACSWTTATEEKEEHYPLRRSNYWASASTFSRDGQLVATCTPNHIHIWQASGPCAGNLVSGPFSNDRVMCLAFSANGQRIVSGSKDGIVRIWNVGTVHRLGGVSPGSQRDVNPISVAFFPDGKHIAVGSWNGAIQVLDAANGQEVARIKDAGDPKMSVKFIAVSVNGDKIAWVDEYTMNIVWAIPTGGGFMGPLTIRLEASVDYHSAADIKITALAFESDLNDLLAFGTYGGIVYLLNASTGALVAEPKEIRDESVTCLAVSSSTTGGTTTAQTRVAVGFIDGLVFIWDIVTGGVAGPFVHHSDSIRALVFSAAGGGRYITSVGKDYSVSMWDATREDLVERLVTTDDESIASWRGKASSLCAALTQDGRKVAFVGKGHRVLVFDVVHNTIDGTSLRIPLVLAGHSNKVTCISFSMDGRFLATTSDDHTIRVWDLQVAAKRKQDIVNAIPEPLHFIDETCINDDGWVMYTDGRGGPPLRLVWIPEVHRASIARPSNVCVVSRIETRLDFENLVHGESWVKCKAL